MMPWPPPMPRLLPTLLALSSALLLTGCAASTPSASARLSLPSLPASVTSCARPSTLPAKSMSRADVERYWARDRAALVRCGAAVDGLVAYYDQLAQQFDAAGNSGVATR